MEPWNILRVIKPTEGNCDVCGRRLVIGVYPHRVSDGPVVTCPVCNIIVEKKDATDNT